MENYSNRLGMRENRLHSSSSVIDMNLLNARVAAEKLSHLKLFSYFSQWSERAFRTCINNTHCQNERKFTAEVEIILPMT